MTRPCFITWCRWNQPTAPDRNLLILKRDAVLATHWSRTGCHTRDRDQKFTDSFDEVFRNMGTEIIRTPFRAPQANGVAERFVRTVRSECLDWLLIFDQQYLERVLTVFADHYDGHRPHRALQLNPPDRRRPPIASATAWGATTVQRRDRLGGVVHEYARVA